MEEYSQEMPGLTLGMYVDISVYVKIGAGDWDTVSATKEAIEVTIRIPEKLQGQAKEFYIIRSHEGECTLLSDMDKEPDTITIVTDKFSTYAITYSQMRKEGNARCSLCHICPTFLGVCCFIWLAVILMIAIVIAILVYRRQKRKDEAAEAI